MQRPRGRKEKAKTGGDRGKQERCEDLTKGGRWKVGEHKRGRN